MGLLCSPYFLMDKKKKIRYTIFISCSIMYLVYRSYFIRGRRGRNMAFFVQKTDNQSERRVVLKAGTIPKII